MTDRTGAPADPTAGFTDMQWYMYHQRNIAFFAAFSTRAFSDDELLTAARALVELAPQLRLGFAGADPARPIPDAVLRRLIYRESVASLEGFPERWLDRGDAVLADPALPLFRIRYAAASSPTTDGRHGFLLVQVSHALVEGEDSALLSRSQSAEHPVSVSERQTAPLVRAAATGLGAILAGLHLLAGNLVTVRPGAYRFATRAYPRLLFSDLARQYGVRQRAVFYALAMHALFDAGTPAGKRRMSSTFSTIDDGGGAGRDAYMRMRMLFAVFDNAANFPDFVRAVDARLTEAAAKESGFNSEMNAEGVRMHRRLSRLMPFAYTPKLFQFMPYDVVLGLIPPHRLGGGLTAGLMEPVYAGAALEGANACVIVPNRRLVTFNFYIQQSLLPRVSRLNDMLGAPLSFRSETTV
ncbi:MAG: hypothetical protein HY834_09425 [Devosia nanyangense]|uniref:Condensation domain-containing protein n=1 Tax=Devosia nanyangense TaxID=1228055 RepID=A0A933L3T9_9HYPH|nr:hypothetical protein [Devosia nanyangense]